MSAPKVGKVYLVGAGPGDPGLLTLRGLACLQIADLVLYDGLVNPLLLRHTSAHAERTCRADTAQGRLLPQAEINTRLIAAAREGKTVVRLKGGDPFVFGRGGEEAAALTAAGIPYEVVPGVTAAVAASAYAGFSLTHRDFASAVAFVTGHEDPSKKCIPLKSIPGGRNSCNSGTASVETICLDYHALAAFPGTLVFYMGLHRLPEIVDALLNAGKPPGTPACVISRGTLPVQQVVSAPLAELRDKVRRAQLHAPSLIVVGDCIRQRETLAWFENRPLFGLTIGITRPVGQAGSAIDRLVELGAQPLVMPTISIEPPEDWSEVDRTLPGLSDFDWIVFTSANGVHGLLRRAWESGSDLRTLGRAKLAVIGEGTAAALAEYHLRADIVPESFRAEALAEALKPHVNGKRVLWVRASRGREVLTQELQKAGAHLKELVVYRNLDVEQLPEELHQQLEAGTVDWICLSSPSIARNLARLLPRVACAELNAPGDMAQSGEASRLRIASISPVTSAAAREVGLPVHAEATCYTWEGIFQAIADAPRL